MRILQVTPYFTPMFGGSSEAAYQLSKELVKRGHHVTVYTSDCKIAREQLFSIFRATIHPFKTWSSVANFYVTPGMITKMGRQARSFDIIHLHNYRTFQNVVAHHYALKHSIPYILQAHGSLPRIISKQGLKQIYDNLWGYKLLKDATKVIATTKTEAEQYKMVGVSGDRIEIAPNGIDLAEFSNLPERGRFKRKYGLSSDQRIILYLGRIHQIKGLDFLVRAFAGMSEDLGNTKLVIAGYDNGYLLFLKRLVADLEIGGSVLFAGALFGQDKLEAYVDAEIYVLPSIYEMFAITILEAFACGTPVIVTDTCALADVINNEAGLVVPHRVLELRLALQELLENEKVRLQFGEKGKLLVREKFNWQTIAGQVESIYREVLR